MAKSSTTPAKQKNLFSFFSKKAPSPTTSTSSSKSAGSPASASSKSSASSSNAKKPAAASSTNTNANAKNKTTTSSSSSAIRKGKCKTVTTAHLKLLSKITIGTKLAVFWPDDSEFYPCTVHAHRHNGGGGHGGNCYVIHYEDGDIETVDLSTEKFRIIGGVTRRVGGEKEKEQKTESKSKRSVQLTSSAKKRRRIMEDSEEDEEMGIEDETEEDSGDDSGSEYKAAGGDDDSIGDESLDAEDDLQDSDEEEDTPTKKKVIKKKITITRVGGGSSTGGSSTTSSAREITPTRTTAPIASTANKKRLAGATMDFSQFASKTPTNGSATKQRPSSSSSSSAKKPPAITQSAKKSSSPNAITQSQSQYSPIQNKNLNTKMDAAATPPKPIAGIANPAGSHMHNHLKFFTTHRKDMSGKPLGHPEYSTRTLRVDHKELANQQDNGKVSPAQQQWWEIKAQYADTVLLFKTGKFYEMFHDDADVGVAVLNNCYMKGTQAHSGFPETAYAHFLDKLVRAGYKVARVEQTETKDEFERRKKSVPRGQKKPQVMCREVCSVVSSGTRTFCYLDNTDKIERGEATTGPLVAIREVLMEVDDREDGMEVDDSEAGTKAVYEYGVTIVDAVTGVVTLGQFADDVLRRRMQTLLASFSPSEVLYEGSGGASKTLVGFLKSVCPPDTILESIRTEERFPKSTAVKAEVRKMLDRVNTDIHPWDEQEAVKELHHRGYYPRSSRKNNNNANASEGIGRWPEILRHCVQGGATLALSSFGAALFYLQRSLIDAEILSMGIVKAYVPPNTSMDVSKAASNADTTSDPSSQLEDMYEKEARVTEGVDLMEQEEPQPNGINFAASSDDDAAAYAAEANTHQMALDGVTISNLELLRNLTSGSCQGSLLSKIDATRSPHGAKLLKSWLLRPLFRKEDIDRRADAVEELAGGSVAVAMAEARDLLKKTGDLERLLCRVHSMGCGVGRDSDDGAKTSAACHPSERAVFYETAKYTKRKVGDFSKILNGLRAAAEIPDVFENVDVQSPMLARLVRTIDEGGCFPSGMKEHLDWFFDNFDLVKAAKGEFEPSRGMDEEYDAACDAIDNVKIQFEDYKEEICSSAPYPKKTRSAWKYINLKEDSKDKYLIELPESVDVPDDFQVKGKRGKGAKQVNKYRSPYAQTLVQELERAIEVKNEGKAAGMKIVFARFDALRSLWTGAQKASSMLDALGALAQLAVQPGFSRPRIMACPPEARPGMEVIQGRHPCVEKTHSGDDFIPNDLVLGSRFESTEVDGFEEGNDAHNKESSVLLLSGPNMGGKSTLLRQTCLISILAQMGSFVPSESCSLTPVDRIFTRLGASDRILCGQSTFFVELAETAAAVRGATRRSLVIMDELGRGTSTFDGTAIASATVKHLVERNRCLTLFATHYHSLLEDWKNEPSIKLGHMECIAEEDDGVDGDSSERKNNITFLYTLGDGPCPKSFGVNVARLAGLPDDVLQRAKRVSSQFEAEMNGETTNQKQHKIIPSTAETSAGDISKLFSVDRLVNGGGLKRIWESLQ